MRAVATGRQLDVVRSWCRGVGTSGPVGDDPWILPPVEEEHRDVAFYHVVQSFFKCKLSLWGEEDLSLTSPRSKGKSHDYQMIPVLKDPLTHTVYTWALERGFLYGSF